MLNTDNEYRVLGNRSNFAGEYLSRVLWYYAQSGSHIEEIRGTVHQKGQLSCHWTGVVTSLLTIKMLAGSTRLRGLDPRQGELHEIRFHPVRMFVCCLWIQPDLSMPDKACTLTVTRY